jgi:transposase-like protein
MTEKERLLTLEERTVLEKLALESNEEGKRAAALLALDDGESQAGAAERTGLTKGQVQYILKKFRSQRLLAFPSALGLLPPDPVQPAIEEAAVPEELGTEERDEKPSTQLGRLLAELDGLVDALRNSIPDASQTPYSPLRMLTLVRSSISRYTPDVQISVLEQFEDMTREDLMDLDTWKGLAYMIAYSAQFQATQTKDKLNEQMPEPLKPDSIFAMVKGGLDRITPDIAKQILSSFEGATREDLLDLDTWKGVWYMLNYSLQFQAEQIKLRLMGEEEE